MKAIYLSVLLLFCASVIAQNSIQFVKDTQLNFKIEDSESADFKLFTNSNFGLENGAYWFKINSLTNNEGVI